MADMALYARADGLLEPRAEKSLEFVKGNSGRMIIANIAQDTRSSLQNRYLNGWIYTKQLARKLEESGQTVNGIPWTRDTLHAVFQNLFLVKYECLFMGSHQKVYESTADMSKKRFTEYINNQVRPFSSSTWGIEIADPNEGYWLEVKKEMER